VTQIVGGDPLHRAPHHFRGLQSHAPHHHFPVPQHPGAPFAYPAYPGSGSAGPTPRGATAAGPAPAPAPGALRGGNVGTLPLPFGAGAVGVPPGGANVMFGAGGVPAYAAAAAPSPEFAGDANAKPRRGASALVSRSGEEKKRKRTSAGGGASRENVTRYHQGPREGCGRRRVGFHHDRPARAERGRAGGERAQ
jgi:hypothetical protein